MTLLTDAEWRTVDGGYRELLQRIAAGTADRRVMRRYYWLSRRLAPFDAALPENWRQETRDRLLRTGSPPPRIDAQRSPSTSPQIPQWGRWVSYGPTNVPGRATALARPAGAPAGTMLAGMADGGVWLTRDSGTNWTPLFDLQAAQSIGAIAVDPKLPNRWYVGTGEGNVVTSPYDGIGVLRTDDGGRTWSQSNLFDTHVRKLLVDASDTNRIFACSDGGLFRSRDGGKTFVVVPGLPARATGIVARPDDPAVLYATFWDVGPYRSSDHGETWTRVGSGLPGTGMGRTDVALCAKRPDTMLLIDAGSLALGEVWRSNDAGANWTKLQGSQNFCGTLCHYALTVAIAPDDCRTMMIGGRDLLVSRDAGVHWTPPTVDAGCHTNLDGVFVDHHGLALFPGGETWEADDGGIHLSTDYGTTWRDVGQGLPSTQYYGACGSDTTAGVVVGGTQDTGVHRHRDNDGWTCLDGGDNGMCGIGGNRIMGEYDSTRVWRSLDLGATLEDATSGIGASDWKLFVGPIEKDPGNATTLYVGTNRIYRTTNFHDTDWVKIWENNSKVVDTLAVSPVDRNVLWAGFQQGGVLRSTNALATAPAFTDVTGSLPGGRAITRIVPHPTSASAAWIALGGLVNPRLFFTADAGVTWSDVTGDLPHVQVNDLLFDPGDLNVLLAATDLGVFRSFDGGSHWSGFSDGLPFVAVTELFRHPVSGTLIAATLGRSMFTFRAAASGPVAVPDGKVVAGRMMTAERTSAGTLWLSYDTDRCTAQKYNLFFGPLSQVASGVYSGANCDLSRGGQTVVPMPGEAGQSLYFLVAGATAAGTEGPHGYRGNGQPEPNTGVGFCGVTSHVATASCP